MRSISWAGSCGGGGGSTKRNPCCDGRSTWPTKVNATLVRAEATQTLAVCLLSIGPAEGQRLIEEAFSLAKEAGDTTNLMRAYNNVSSTQGRDAGPAPAVETLREGLELALRSGTIANAGWIAGSLGDELDVLGRLAEAEDSQRLAVDLARRIGDAPLTGQRVGALALRRQRGRIDEALTIRDEAAPSSPRTRSRRPPTPCRCWTGFAVARGDLAAPRGEVRRVGGLPPRLQHRRYAGGLRRMRADVLALGSSGPGRDLSRPRCLNRSVQSAAHARNSGLLERRSRPAVELLRDAVAEFERLEIARLRRARMVDLGRAMARAGDDPRESWSAPRILTECDARLFLPEVDEALAQLG